MCLSRDKTSPKCVYNQAHSSLCGEMGQCHSHLWSLLWIHVQFISAFWWFIHIYLSRNSPETHTHTQSTYWHLFIQQTSINPLRNQNKEAADLPEHQHAWSFLQFSSVNQRHLCEHRENTADKEELLTARSHTHSSIESKAGPKLQLRIEKTLHVCTCVRRFASLLWIFSLCLSCLFETEVAESLFHMWLKTLHPCWIEHIESGFSEQQMSRWTVKKNSIPREISVQDVFRTFCWNRKNKEALSKILPSSFTTCFSGVKLFSASGDLRGVRAFRWEFRLNSNKNCRL